MGPADYDLRPLGAPADLRDVGLQPLAVAVRLRGNLLRLREERLDLAQVEQRVPMGVLLDDPRDDVALAARELLVRELTLGVAELLVNDLLRGLGPDPALELVGDLDLALAFGVPLPYRLDRPALGASYLPDPPTQTPSEPIGSRRTRSDVLHLPSPGRSPRR